MAAKELEQETGLRADRLELVAIDLFVSPGYSDELMALYIASGLTPTKQREENGYIEPMWIPFADLDKTIRTIRDLKSYALLQELRYRLRFRKS